MEYIKFSVEVVSLNLEKIDLQTLKCAQDPLVFTDEIFHGHIRVPEV